MAITLIATPGASNANTYGTQTEADDYFASRLQSSGWTSNVAKQAAALVTACNRLEQETYSGYVVSESQALKWPRSGVSNRDTGGLWSEFVVPRPVKCAQFELALVLIASGEDFVAETGLEGFSRIVVGPIDVTIESQRPGGTLPAEVVRLLTGFRLGGSGSVRILRA